MGLMLLIVAGFSLLGLCCAWCRCSAVVSGYLATAVGLVCLVLSVVFLVLKTLIFEYFEKDGKELGLSPSDVKLAEAWYLVIDVGLFTVSALEGVRYFASLKYHETTCKIDSESIPLLSGRNV
jgi:hypothetical protein